MKKWFLCSCLLVCVLLFGSSVSYAQVFTVEAVGSYLIGDGPDENVSVAKTRAREDAMCRAVEQVGVYVESYSKTRNAVVTSDEITVVAAQMIKIIDETIVPTVTSENHVKYTCKIKATIDNEAIDLKKILSNREAVEKSVELEKQIAKLQKENTRLKRLYKESNNSTERETISKQIGENERGFTQAVYSLPIYTSERGWHTGIDVDSIQYDKTANVITFTSTETKNGRDGKTETKFQVYVNTNEIRYVSCIGYNADGTSIKIKGIPYEKFAIAPGSLEEKYQKKIYAYLGVVNAPVNKAPKWVYVTARNGKDGDVDKYYIDTENMKIDDKNMTVQVYTQCKSTNSVVNNLVIEYIFDLSNYRILYYLPEAGKFVVDSRPQQHELELYQFAAGLYASHKK